MKVSCQIQAPVTLPLEGTSVITRWKTGYLRSRLDVMANSKFYPDLES